MTVSTRAAATVVAAVATALVATSGVAHVQAAPLRTAAAAGTVSAAADPVAARIVTPPASVTRAQLVRIFRKAAKASAAAQRRGAAVRIRTEVGAQAQVATGRMRAGRLVLRGTDGSRTVVDTRTGSAYLPIADIASGVGATQAEVDAALAELGRPTATWAVLSAGGSAPGSSAGAQLVRLAKHATGWSWTRSKGLTTWQLTSSPSRGVTATTVVVLDRKQRVVREAETRVSTSPKRREKQVIAFTYERVAPIAVPAESQTVEFVALIAKLAGLPGQS